MIDLAAEINEGRLGIKGGDGLCAFHSFDSFKMTSENLYP